MPTKLKLTKLELRNWLLINLVENKGNDFPPKKTSELVNFDCASPKFCD